MALRRIEPLAPGMDGPAEHGPVPEQRWLTIDSLRVDDAYQRPIAGPGRGTIRLIVAGFDWRMFAPVVVCPIEGGVYAIVDGQHRVTAAATLGIAEVPCHIIQADRTMQARSFHAINGHVTKMPKGALYRARLAAGDPMALRVKAVAATAGIRVLTFNPNWSSLKPRETTSHAAIETALGAHGEAVVETALRALAQSAGEGTGVITAVSIAVFVAIVADHPEWSRTAHFVETCALFDVETAMDEAKESRHEPRRVFLQGKLALFLKRQYAAAGIAVPGTAAGRAA